VRRLAAQGAELDYALVSAAVAAAFSGALMGNYFLKKISMRSIQVIVAGTLAVVALGLASGLL